MSYVGSDERSMDRLVNFSDAVYAIAITLLILTIEIPTDLKLRTNAEVLHVLGTFLPQFSSYVLSFWIIGMYLTVHHRMYRSIVKANDTLLYLNLLTLFCISFIPIPTAVLSRAGDTSIGVAFYALWMVFVSGSFQIMWRYAVKNHRLVNESLSESVITSSEIRGLVPIIIFLVSIPAAFLSPYLAEGIWMLIFLIRPRIMHIAQK